ncbi:MAG: VOC family protein [Roseibium sp.]|uniref:VOC family protein n=1 Tax=Roseibium sp. TaxID=1936156 RepID=UPI001B008F90|nr:VOC family protein [Roseibium sp.]MBO6892013.1 VOC family protein [Roseibium sp.]MBO6932973.1 VOC family protein [Roseibium sp.]
MKYLHTMLRVSNLEDSIAFFELLGFAETARYDEPEARFTIVMMAPPGGEDTPVELTWNYDPEDLGEARFFGHLAYEVDNIYETCAQLQVAGVTINRPPRDGRMAFIRTPDNHSIEFLQKGDALAAQEPWASMANTGRW